jgi:hypothetical protein
MENSICIIDVEEIDGNITIKIDTKQFIFTKEYIGKLYDKHPIRKIYNEWKRKNVYHIITDDKPNRTDS